MPAVTIVSTMFMGLRRAVAKGPGAAHTAIADYQGVPLIDSREQLREKVINIMRLGDTHPGVANCGQDKRAAG